MCIQLRLVRGLRAEFSFSATTIFGTLLQLVMGFASTAHIPDLFCADPVPGVAFLLPIAFTAARIVAAVR